MDRKSIGFELIISIQMPAEVWPLYSSNAPINAMYIKSTQIPTSPRAQVGRGGGGGGIALAMSSTIQKYKGRNENDYHYTM